MAHDRLVLMMGSQTQWTECGFGQAGRNDCPVCRNRNLARERQQGLNRTCLRCLTSTWDFDRDRHHVRSGVQISPPLNPTTALHKLTRRLRRTPV